MGVKVHEIQCSKHLSVYAHQTETPLVYQSLKNDNIHVKQRSTLVIGQQLCIFLLYVFVKDAALCDWTVIFLFLNVLHFLHSYVWYIIKLLSTKLAVP